MRQLYVVLAISAFVPLANLPLGHFERVFGAFSEQPVRSASSVQESTRWAAEYEQFSAIRNQFPAKQMLDALAIDIGRITDNSRAGSAYERELNVKKIATLNQAYQLVVDTQALLNVINELYQEREQLGHLDLANLVSERRTMYSFTDLEYVRQKMWDTHNRIEDLTKTDQKLQVDYDRFTKTIETTQKEYKQQQDKQKNYIGQRIGVAEAELLDYQLKVTTLRKEYAQLKVREIQLRKSILTLQLSALKSQRDVLEHEYERIKQSTVITHDDVKRAVLALEEKTNSNYHDRKRLREQKMPFITQARQETQRNLETLISQYGLTAQDLTAVRQWNFQAKTAAQWKMLCELHAVLTRDALIDTNKEYVQAESDFLRAELKREIVDVAIIKAWEKFFSRKMRGTSEHGIEESTKEFEGIKNEISAQLRQVTDARDAAISSLQRLNKSLENVKNTMQFLVDQRRGLFKDHEAVLQQCNSLLKDAEESIRQKIDTTAQLIEKYQATVSVLDDAFKRALSMLTELTSKGFWRRSDHSIEWGQIKNVVPDLKRFAYDIFITGREYMGFHYLAQLSAKVLTYARDPLNLLMLCIIAIVFCAIYMLLRFFLPDLYQYVNGPVYGSGIIPYMQLFLALLIKFTIVHFNSLYVWGLAYGFVSLGIVHDHFIAMIVHLASIPYLIYLLVTFMIFLQAENKYRNFTLIASSYQSRFVTVICVVGGCWIVLYFLRGALLLDYSLNTELPTILLATMFIVLQVGLITLVGKKEILAITPSDTPLWQWVKDHLNRYYYVLWIAFIAVIVMSNPYVGYGRQVFYITSRIVVTMLIIPVFLWLHSRLKRVSSSLFFYYEGDENLRERFSSGRIWYGAFIIVSFILFVMLMVFTVGMIWGYGLSPSDMLGFLRRELTAIKDDAGREVSVTILSLLQIILFILGGVLVNYGINEFVIKRVFDPFLVGTGVQNAISALARYGIIITAIFMGLTNAGLEGLTTKFAILLAGIGIAVQEPLRDFFSYFIILVQRPVKVGDLIQINEDVIGVVRHITPRSVILRRRNSVTVVVPNSHIILNSVTNWNYTRGFFAFHDILLTVPFTADPQAVKDIILAALHANSTILKSPAPIVWLDNFVENGYQFLVRGFLTSDKVLEQWEIGSQVRLEIVKRLREKSIVIASPTRHITVAHPSASSEKL